MKLRDLLKVTAIGQEVIVRLMYPTDKKELDYEMEFDFVHRLDGTKLDPTYIGTTNHRWIGDESDRKVLTDVFNILLKMDVDMFCSDIDFGKTEWDDYAPIGDYDINDRVIVTLKPIAVEDMLHLIPKKFTVQYKGTQVPNKNYVTKLYVVHDHKTVVIL